MHIKKILNLERIQKKKEKRERYDKKNERKETGRKVVRMLKTQSPRKQRT